MACRLRLNLKLTKPSDWFNPMELRHLRYFVAVAEELHFGRAAARLHISQPPLSQQIGNLEEELGLKLFSRRHRRVELTNAGRVFLIEAKQTLLQIEKAAAAAKRADRGEIGPLVVACSPIAVHTVLPLVLKDFRAQLPEVEIGIRELMAQEIFESLRERSADVGLLMPLFESQGLQRQIVLTVPMIAALPKAHPLAKRRHIRLKQLAHERFVLFSRRWACGFYEHAIGLCRRGGFTPKVVHEAAQHPTLLALVAAGYGVSLIPALDKRDIPEGVAIVRIEERWATMQLCMAWRSGESSSMLATFLNAVRACCLKTAAKKHWPRVRAKR